MSRVPAVPERRAAAERPRVMIYRFGNCELDTARHELRVDGRPRATEPQVFDLLRHMVENRGRLISRDELVEAVWQGRIVSDAAISARINAARQAVGDDGTRQKVIRTVPRRGFRLVAGVEACEDEAAARGTGGGPAHQKVRFCTSRDGTRIAYATTGSGYPLLRAGHWLTHLEHDWQSPLRRLFLDELGRNFAVTRYDQRGNGLSDWAVNDFSLEAFVDDLEAVADAAGLERFAIYGTSQGTPIAIAYAARRPERVSHLVLHGGFVVGRTGRASAAEREQGEALQTLMRHGWGKAGSPFIQAFTSIYAPEANEQQVRKLVEMQQYSTSPENAVRLRAAVDAFDVSDLLGHIAAPTLVIHARNDAVHPLDQGRRLAAGIAGAEFMLLESPNHVLLPQEPAWSELLEAIRSFVLDGP